MKKQKQIAMGGVAMVAGIVGVSAQESAPLFKIGSVDVRPHVAYGVVYDDNIYLEHKGNRAAATPANNTGRDHDFIHTFTPGLRLNAGDAGARQSAYFDANYEVVFTKFTDYSGSDATDHNASIEFGGKFNRLDVGVSQSLASRSDADVANLAANGRVRRKTWTTKVDSDYEVSEKTSMSLNLLQTIGDYGAPLVDSTERSAHLWLDYQVLPKVKAGFGGGIGYLQVEGNAASHNPNSAYYQGQGRLSWTATEKVTVDAAGGLEYRNIQERSAGDPVGVIFSLNANWKASERTTIGVGASRGRRVSNALGAQLNEETAFTASLKQGLMERLSLAVDGGYSYSHYDQTVVLAAASVRDDAYFFVKPSLSYRFLERAQATVYYQYRRNDSNLAANANDFYGNQLGLELSYRF